MESIPGTQAPSEPTLPRSRPGGAAPIKVLIADDHDLIRQAVTAILKDTDIEVIGEASSGMQAIRYTTELQPDILLLDICMPELDGLEVAERLSRLAPTVKVLVLSQIDSMEHLVRLLKLGAAGYVLKDNAAHELVYAIHTVQKGLLYLTPRMTTHLVQHSFTSGTEQNVSRLSPREIEILRLIAEGATGPQIAERLGLSVKTVQAHRTNIMEKLNLHSRVDLVRYAIKVGLVNTD